MSARPDGYWKAVHAKRREDPAYLQQQSERHRIWYAANGKTPERLARKAEQMREYAKAHGTAEHHKARRKVRHEIQMGRMTRLPCEVCGTDANVHAHHDDYSRPLDVRWLCAPHHRDHHARATGAA